MIARKEAHMERSRTGFFIITALFTGIVLSLSVTSAYGQWAATYGGLNGDFPSSIQQTADGGYIAAGYTYSFGAGSYCDAWVMKLDSTGAITWQKTYGGTNYDVTYSIQQTADGGYIVAGSTQSFGAGSNDVWIMKLESTGAITWQKTYGGTGTDYASSIQQTLDGGYIVAGSIRSFGAGDSDVWVMKLDATGGVTWQRTYGGVDSDWAHVVQQTQDGGYIVAGATYSFGEGDRDAWVLKLDSTGAVTWQKTYGGEAIDFPYSIQQTQDGGYVLAGYTESFDPDDRDAWVLKLDSTGAITWQKSYGGIGSDDATSIQQSEDGGFIVAGYTQSFGAGSLDAWIMKLDGTGAITWQKTYGGVTGQKLASSIQQTQDGGYIVMGANGPFGDAYDIFILKLDSSGSIGSCPFEGVSTAVVADTTVTGVDTTVVPANTTVTGVDSTATVSDSSASANQWCPLGEDTQRLKVGTTRKKKGEGTIISGEGLLSCPDKCQEEYNKGLTVTLYADPSDLSTFLGWKPASLGCEGTDPCQVSMDKKKSVKAIFQGPNKLKVVTTFKKGGMGSVSSGDALISCPGDCEELYILNAPVTLTATAGDGSTFIKWTGRPCKDEPTNICTFTMDKNATVKAVFQANPD